MKEYLLIEKASKFRNYFSRMNIQRPAQALLTPYLHFMPTYE